MIFLLGVEELAKYLESVEDTQRKVKSAMYYPVFIIGFLGVMLFVTFTFIIPEFEAVYQKMGQDELPFYTEAMLWLGARMQENIFLKDDLLRLKKSITLGVAASRRRSHVSDRGWRKRQSRCTVKVKGRAVTYGTP